MASTGSIGMTRPMKKVTQVRPRNVNATESSRFPRWRMVPTRRRPHPSFAIAATWAATAGDEPSLRDGAIEVEILEEAGLEALHVSARSDLVGILEHDDERPLVGHLLLKCGVFGLPLLGVDL